MRRCRRSTTEAAVAVALYWWEGWERDVATAVPSWGRKGTTPEEMCFLFG